MRRTEIPPEIRVILIGVLKLLWSPVCASIGNFVGDDDGFLVCSPDQ